MVWGWLDHQLVFSVNSIADLGEKLKKTVEIVACATVQDFALSHINEVLLNKIVINEYSRSYLAKEIDIENKEAILLPTSDWLCVLVK